MTLIGLGAGGWELDGAPTYPGAPAAGLLMNVRMVNAVFEDADDPTFDPEANTARFLAQVPAYATCGVRAFTISLQGGFPGYEGARCTAFDPDGSLRAGYLARVGTVIETCARHGVAVILSCFYQRQERFLAGEDAVRAGALAAASWIMQSGFRNVILEIANEYGHRGYKLPILSTAQGQVELIELARGAAPDLLIATSRQAHKELHADVIAAGDLVLLHLNQVPLERRAALLTELRRYGKPVVCNEDLLTGAAGAEAARLCVEHGCSWGLMAREVNQYHPPFRFAGPADDPEVYAALRELTAAGGGERMQR